MAGHGGKRPDAGRPSLLNVWRWCVARCLDYRADQQNLRDCDPLEAHECEKIEKARIKLAELDDLSKLEELGDLRKQPLELRSRITAFADRLEEIVDAGRQDAEDNYARVLAEAGALRPYCEALMQIREVLDPGGHAPYSRLHRSVRRRRRLKMDGIDGIYERVADDASKHFNLPIKGTSVKREWKYHSRLINKAVKACSPSET
jgi:hypothetical protein